MTPCDAHGLHAERVAAQIEAALRYRTGTRQRKHLEAALRLLLDQPEPRWGVGSCPILGCARLTISRQAAADYSNTGMSDADLDDAIAHARRIRDEHQANVAEAQGFADALAALRYERRLARREANADA